MRKAQFILGTVAGGALCLALFTEYFFTGIFILMFCVAINEINAVNAQ